jgi:hypothetical protein
MKALKLRVPFSFTANCAAGGVISSVASVLADSNAAEWAGLLALYDEYRVLGGSVAYCPGYQTTAGASSPDVDFLVIAYDPVDGSVLTSVRNGTELSQHQLRRAQAASQSATTSAALTRSFGAANGLPYVFKFDTQKVRAFAASSSAVALASGSWKIMNTAGSNQTDGYLKFYGTSDNASAVACISGIVYLNVEFRSRK